MIMDTGRNAPESVETLKLQQKALIEGRRDVQMFPIGTVELDLPAGMQRYVNERGVFHYNPEMITWTFIQIFSGLGEENVFLQLGPYSKNKIFERVAQGEKPFAVTEYTPTGIEVRCALGSESTILEQRTFFELTKEPDNVIVVGPAPERVIKEI